MASAAYRERVPSSRLPEVAAVSEPTLAMEKAAATASEEEEEVRGPKRGQAREAVAAVIRKEAGCGKAVASTMAPRSLTG